MKTFIPDLSIERLGPDLVRLEQAYGWDDPVIIDLHRIHVAHLARLFGVAEAQLDASAESASGTGAPSGKTPTQIELTA